MEGNTNKYQRDFYGWGQLALRNRAVPDLWDHKNDIGDGAGGIQYMIHLLVSAYGPRLLIEGLSLSGTAANPIVAAGYAMIDGKVCQLKVADTIACSSGQFVYLDFISGHAQGDGEGELVVDSYANIATCPGFPIVYNLSSVQTDIRSYVTFMSIQMLQSLTVRGNTRLKGTLTVEGIITDRTGNVVFGEPIGTIKMFDGTGWVDNSTIPGWYAMISDNVGVGCTDMVNKFAMGKVVAGAGSTGGSNTNNHTHSVTSNVSVSQQPAFTTPAHYHGKGTLSISTSSGEHQHAFYMGGGTIGSGYPRVQDLSNYVGYTLSEYAGAYAGRHQHANSTFSGSVGTTGGSNGDSAFANTRISDVTLSNPAVTSATPSDTENRPAYYSMIFIRRCV